MNSRISLSTVLLLGGALIAAVIVFLIGVEFLSDSTVSSKTAVAKPSTTSADVQPAPGPKLSRRKKPAVTETADSDPSDDLERWPEKPDHWDLIPTPSDLDDTYPGLSLAYNEAGFRASREFRDRHEHECMKLVPRDIGVISYKTLETYEPDGTGQAVLTRRQIFPDIEGHDDYFRCIRGSSVGRVKVALPDGFSEGFELRHGMQRLVDDTPLTAEKVQAHIREFTRRLTDPSLGPEKRAYFEQRLRRATCFLDNNLEGVEDCE